MPYEELCNAPSAALKPVGKCLELDFDMIGESLGNGRAFKPIPHMLRGNTRLGTSQEIVLKQDNAFLSQMRWPDRAIVALVSRVPVFCVPAGD
jgi:hypothetical protein